MEFVPLEELTHRIEALQERLIAHDLDGMLLMQNVDLFYFTGTVQNGILFVPSAGAPLFMVRKSFTRARIESPLDAIVPLESFRQTPDLIRSRGNAVSGRLGVELDVLPAALYERMTGALAEATLIDASGLVRQLRSKKSPYEIGMMRKAADQLAAGFDALRSVIREGMREIEICAELEAVLRREGHQGVVRARRWNMELWYGAVSIAGSASYPVSFDGPVGVTGLYPAVPQSGGERRLGRGEPIVVDIVGGHAGYLVDKTRVFSLGEPNAKYRELYELALAVEARIEKRLRPGEMPGEIYDGTIDYVSQTPHAEAFMGCGENRVGFVGHGIGLEIDELPVLAHGSDTPLEAGMTVAIEPKFFYPEIGGAGIEDTYLVTESGPEKLTPYPTEMIILPG